MLGLLAAAPAAWAQTADSEALENEVRARDDRIVDLERKVDVLVDEIARLRTQVAVPEETELKSAYGLGPAASKVYGIERGLSIGGYGEANYSNRLSGDSDDTGDALRFVQYIGYKFNENIILNTEIEYEHATTGSTPNSSGGSVSIELMTLDFFWKKEANFRTGLVLVPMGFINEIHEPPSFFGVQRPEVERRIIPSTWRELGVGVFGDVGEDISYRAYVMNGFDATGFSSSGIRGGRQKGNRVRADDLAFVGRVDWTPGEEWLVGTAVYVGNGGQDQDGIPSSRLTMFEAHAQYNNGPWHGRGLFAINWLDDAEQLSTSLGLPSGKPVGDRMLGGYGELAYDVWALITGNNDKYLAPFARVEYVDTQNSVPSGFSRDGTKRYVVSSFGMNFKPHPNVVLKAEYRNFSVQDGDISDEISLGMGFAF
jgi:hypothetical protein